MLELGGSGGRAQHPQLWLHLHGVLAPCLTPEQGGTAAGARFWGRSTGWQMGAGLGQCSKECYDMLWLQLILASLGDISALSWVVGAALKYFFLSP